MLDGRWLAPVRRHILDPLYCLKNGSPLRRRWKELEHSQYLPEEVLSERQRQGVMRLLEHASRNNRFYRERFDSAGVDAKAITSLQELARIPILTKEEVRANAGAMISDGYDRERLMRMKTGGSTGRSLEVFLTEECSELRNALARRHDRWSGWEVGEPVAAVWGNVTAPATAGEWLRQRLLYPCISLDTMAVTEEAVLEFARQWRRTRPTLLFGHAHSIFVLARYLDSLGIALTPRAIIATSMMLAPHERKVIESVLGVPVTDRYGCEEVSLIASECERHEGMHLNIEHLVVEFVTDSGAPAAPGETGRIVVTDLVNLAMPLIRYDVGDLGVPSRRKCPCGRTLPLMERVMGRSADFLVTREKVRIAGISLIENTLTRVAGVVQMQIVQETPSDLTLRIVKGDDFCAGSERELGDYFRGLFGEDARVTFEYCDTIPADGNGKFRFSISKVDTP